MALNKQQEMFCRDYVATGYNKIDSYVRVYRCSRESAWVGSSNLMKKQDIKDYISELEKEIFEANHINAEHIANELATMAFGKVNEETGISHQTKLKALDLLQKQVGLQTQNIKADVNQDIVIKIKGEKPNEGT